MNYSNSRRFINLMINLVQNPDLIPSYIRHNLLSKKMPADLGLPWWSYRAIQYVDTIVKGKRIFEYGTGGSTIRFAQKAKCIEAVEDDEKWIDAIQQRLARLNITNVYITKADFDFRNPVNFEKSDYLKAVDKGEWDIIIIDGQDRSRQERIKCFHYVEGRMKPGQFIVVDDFWRYERLRGENRAKELKVFKSIGPGRYGVTSTAVFLY